MHITIIKVTTKKYLKGITSKPVEGIKGGKDSVNPIEAGNEEREAKEEHG